MGKIEKMVSCYFTVILKTGSYMVTQDSAMDS